jgi:ankyrin repeat protein
MFKGLIARNNSERLGKELIKAATTGDQGKCRDLLAKGANTNYQDKDGLTAYCFAISCNHPEITNLLIENAMSPRNKPDNAPLSSTTGNTYNRLCALLPSKYESYKTPLHYFAETTEAYYSSVLASHLISTGVIIEHKDGWGNTPLLYAVKQRATHLVEFLIQNGANKEAKDSNGETALLLASKFGHVSIAEFLIQNEANIEAENSNGKTPLLLAADFRRVAIVKLLIKAGAILEARDKDGNTPLLLATKSENISIVTLLINKGANQNVMDKDGKTPLSWVIETGNIPMAKLLTQNEAILQQVEASHNSKVASRKPPTFGYSDSSQSSKSSSSGPTISLAKGMMLF